MFRCSNAEFKEHISKHEIGLIYFWLDVGTASQKLAHYRFNIEPTMGNHLELCTKNDVAISAYQVPKI